MDTIPEPVVRMLPETNRIPFFTTPHARLYTESDSRHLGEPPTRYDLDDLDVAWLELVNTEFRELALPELDELSMERVLEELERQCQEKMQQAIETEEGLGIEYDEDVVCDVCRSPEGEDGNEMVFCDKCNICVHQACYGILKVPQGNWLCRTCALGVQPKCLLCPKRGGALKPTRSGTKWVHVSCALWIPEVSIGCPEKMEPITKVSHIPASRWALSCSLCREHTGTCIQCSMPSCIVAFHVTCAFEHGLEMHTILAENDEVRFKSYCLEHSYNTNTGAAAAASTDHPRADAGPQPQPDRQKASSQRKQKLQELEDEFYRLVEPRAVADRMGLPDAHVDFLFQFWKLRRRANFNRPLVAVKRDEVDNLAQQEQDVLYRRLKLFTHLRQDLERVRNLCYMVTRREKMKHSLCDVQEKIFHLQIQLLEKDLAGDKTLKGEKGRKQNGVKERGKERRSDGTKERWKSDNGSLLRQLGVPLDGSLFDSWLAQSVQITADDMLSRWTLEGERRDPTASLLSHQLQQGEQNLLNLMMDHSMQSAWKTPQLGRKARTKPRAARAHKDSTSSSSSSSATCCGGTPGTPVTAAAAAAAAKGLRSVCEEAGGYGGYGVVGRRGERLRASRALLHHHHHHAGHLHHHHLHHHHHHTRHSAEAQPEPLQPPISKMDSCHISDERGPWQQPHPRQPAAGAAPEPGGGGGLASASATPESPESPAAVGGGGGGGAASVGRPALRARVTRQGKSRSKGGGGGVGCGGGGQESAEPDRDAERTEEASPPPPLPVAETPLTTPAGTNGYFSDAERNGSDPRPTSRKLRLGQLHAGNEEVLRRSVLAS
ncbi:E3 ubiquitin-protein ligase Jade-2 [Sardina pilchardus]|uniref:E3 ubiquitin-protein ligase Jade-2 n=1 Tax=Sardina pilchardus TaxID=27697 RepID=UPI002E163DA3